MHAIGRRYNTPEKRWAGIGPYYAMFPVNFADDVIQKYTNPGDGVLDPFAGRGTAIYSAAIQDRVGIGIEINPVGWVYAKDHPNVSQSNIYLGDCVKILSQLYKSGTRD